MKIKKKRYRRASLRFGKTRQNFGCGCLGLGESVKSDSVIAPHTMLCRNTSNQSGLVCFLTHTCRSIEGYGRNWSISSSPWCIVNCSVPVLLHELLMCSNQLAQNQWQAGCHISGVQVSACVSWACRSLSCRRGGPRDGPEGEWEVWPKRSCCRSCQLS